MAKAPNWFRDIFWFLGVGLSRLFNLDLFGFFGVYATSLHNCSEVQDQGMAIELTMVCRWGKVLDSVDDTIVTSHATFTTTWYEDQKPEHVADNEVQLIELKVYIPVKCRTCDISINVGRVTDAVPQCKELKLTDLSGMRIYHFSVPIGALLESLNKEEKS